jgi:hypothetical protein
MEYNILKNELLVCCWGLSFELLVSWVSLVSRVGTSVGDSYIWVFLLWGQCEPFMGRELEIWVCFEMEKSLTVESKTFVFLVSGWGIGAEGGGEEKNVFPTRSS